MKKKTKEQIEEEMETGEADDDIYTKEGAEVSEDEESITNVEEAFMDGYNESESPKKRLKSDKDEE